MGFLTFFPLVSLLLVIVIHDLQSVITEKEALSLFFDDAMIYVETKGKLPQFEQQHNLYENGNITAADFAELLQIEIQEMKLQFSDTLLKAIALLINRIITYGTYNIWCSFSSDGQGSTCSFLKKIFTQFVSNEQMIHATFGQVDC